MTDIPQTATQEPTPGPYVIDVDGRGYMIRTKAVGTGQGEAIARKIMRHDDAQFFASAPTLAAEVAALRSTIAAWENVFLGIEAHLLDRIAMNDQANPQTYLDIIRTDVRELPRESRQIYEASQQRFRTTESQNAALRERNAALEKALRALIDASGDEFDPAYEAARALLKVEG